MGLEGIIKLCDQVRETSSAIHVHHGNGFLKKMNEFSVCGIRKEAMANVLVVAKEVFLTPPSREKLCCAYDPFLPLESLWSCLAQLIEFLVTHYRCRRTARTIGGLYQHGGFISLSPIFQCCFFATAPPVKKRNSLRWKTCPYP